jgi:DNA-directed RNA polymerase-3 subunit RPC5
MDVWCSCLVLGALHLHPITRVLQMRTNLTYLDDRDTEQKEHKRRYAEDMDGDKKKKAAPAQSRPSVSIKFANTICNSG